jgi:hypothetical protein
MPTAFYPGPTLVTLVPSAQPAEAMLGRGFAQGGAGESGPFGDGDHALRARARARKLLLALALATAIVLILLVLYHMFAPRTLAHGLAQCGWTLYLLEGDAVGLSQLSLLDGFAGHVVFCGSGSGSGEDLAPTAGGPHPYCGGIQAFPFWYNSRTGEERPGYQNRAALERMAQW